jgi:Lrp/AsnC family transcriptional regulator
MSQAEPLDTHDKAILRELQRDASLALDALAERVHLSRNACWRRVKALEERGVIRGRIAVVDPAALGLGLSVLVSIRTSRHDQDWAERFHAAVAAIPEITAAYRTAGEIDYILHARVADVAAYDRLYKKLIAKTEMVDVSASFVMETLKESHILPVDGG